MTKSERFRDARLKSGKSQRELADIMGVSQAYINGLENDKPFSLKKAKIIAPLIGVDAEWLYFGDELSQKSQNKPLSKSGGLSTQGVNFNDIGQLNTKLAFPENSTFPVDNKNMPNSDNREDTPKWRQLYNIQQEEINLLNRKIELLNQLIQSA